MNGAVDAASAAQRPIGGVDDGVYFQARDVTQKDADAFVKFRINWWTVVKGAENKDQGRNDHQQKARADGGEEEEEKEEEVVAERRRRRSSDREKKKKKKKKKKKEKEKKKKKE